MGQVHGQNNAINPVVEIIIPETLPARAETVNPKPKNQADHARIRKTLGIPGVNRVSMIPATVYSPFAAPAVKRVPARWIASRLFGSQPINSDSAIKSQAMPAAATHQAAMPHPALRTRAAHQ